uniref:Plasminogen receptor (KT) n=1 Tax=Strigamia maritima TaxID=126957 RepID=T1J1M9_STRMM
MERQIHLQNQMRERQMAMQVAKTREMLFWIGSFYILATFAMISRYRKTKNSSTLAPIVPFSFFIAYQADLAYGSKLTRIKNEAENILEYETQLIHLPNGVPTAQSIDQARQRQHEEQRIRKVHELYI